MLNICVARTLCNTEQAISDIAATPRSGTTPGSRATPKNLGRHVAQELTNRLLCVT